MKFGQLIEYNTKNIFVEKSYICAAEPILDPYLKKKIKFEHISGSIV